MIPPKVETFSVVTEFDATCVQITLKPAFIPISSKLGGHEVHSGARVFIFVKDTSSSLIMETSVSVLS